MQDNRKDTFDVVITYADRVMERLCEDLAARPAQGLNKPVLIVNLDTVDNAEQVRCALRWSHTVRLFFVPFLSAITHYGLRLAEEKRVDFMRRRVAGAARSGDSPIG